MSTYLYGIVGATHPKNVAELRGVGEEPSALRTVPAGELAAVVGDAPDGLRAKRRDLAAHQHVLEELCAQGATLPMRFGVVADDDESIAREVSAEVERYTQLLANVEGRFEINVKVAHEESAILRRILMENEELRRMNEDLRQQDGGSPDDRVRFGEAVAAALDDRGQRDAAAVTSALSGHAVHSSTGPAVDGCFVNASFLVDQNDAERFNAAVEEVREAFAEIAEVRVYGPLPPYSFIETAGTP